MMRLLIALLVSLTLTSYAKAEEAVYSSLEGVLKSRASAGWPRPEPIYVRRSISASGSQSLEAPHDAVCFMHIINGIGRGDCQRNKRRTLFVFPAWSILAPNL